MRCFNLLIIFFVVVCILLIRFCVFVYFLVDVDLCCLKYLVMVLDSALIVLVLLVVKREKRASWLRLKLCYCVY